jgi:hypothetical protein
MFDRPKHLTRMIHDPLTVTAEDVGRVKIPSL